MIEVKNITKYYGKFKALDDVSFSVEKGEIVGFLGPNGAGKTTTMKILTCFMYPTEGDVLIKGLSVWDEADKIKQNIGYLPENNPLYPEMVVYSYLSFIADVRGVEDTEKSIREVVEKTGLKDVLHKPIGELSKGYRQRVGLAQALIHNPDILILDEPTSGLDPNQIAEVRNVIKEIGKDKTIIISTHILSEVEQMCERAIIINNGKIVADGKIEELKGGISGFSPIDVGLKGEIEEGKLKNLFKDLGQLSDYRKENGITFFKLKGNNKDEIRDKIFKIAVENGFVLVELHKQSETLEYLFRKLTVEEEKGGEA